MRGGLSPRWKKSDAFLYLTNANRWASGKQENVKKTLRGTDLIFDKWRIRIFTRYELENSLRHWNYGEIKRIQMKNVKKWKMILLTYCWIFTRLVLGLKLYFVSLWFLTPWENTNLIIHESYFTHTANAKAAIKNLKNHSIYFLETRLFSLTIFCLSSSSIRNILLIRSIRCHSFSSSSSSSFFGRKYSLSPIFTTFDGSFIFLSIFFIVFVHSFFSSFSLSNM